MFIKDLKTCVEFTAGDGSVLRELLHPLKADLKLGYSLAYVKVSLHQVTKPHKLKSSEVYYILEGEGIMYIEKEESRVYPGYAIYIPPNSKQYIKNIGTSDLKFLCIVDPAWRPEDEEVLG